MRVCISRRESGRRKNQKPEEQKQQQLKNTTRGYARKGNPRVFLFSVRKAERETERDRCCCFGLIKIKIKIKCVLLFCDVYFWKKKGLGFFSKIAIFSLSTSELLALFEQKSLSAQQQQQNDTLLQRARINSLSLSFAAFKTRAPRFLLWRERLLFLFLI